MYIYMYMLYTCTCTCTYLGNVENEKTGHAGGDDHEHGQAVGGVDEMMNGQHEAQGCADAHHDDHNVHGDADEARVVDVSVLDVAALVGKEEPKDDKKTFVDVESSDQVPIVVTVTLFVVVDHVIVIILVGGRGREGVSEGGERGVRRRGKEGQRSYM